MRRARQVGPAATVRTLAMDLGPLAGGPAGDHIPPNPRSALESRDGVRRAEFKFQVWQGDPSLATGTPESNRRRTPGLPSAARVTWDLGAASESLRTWAVFAGGPVPVPVRCRGGGTRAAVARAGPPAGRGGPVSGTEVTASGGTVCYAVARQFRRSLSDSLEAPMARTQLLNLRLS